MAAKPKQGSIQAVSLSDYDKMLSMTDLEAKGTAFYVTAITMEERDVIEPGEPPKSVVFVTFSVLSLDGDWIGDVTTRGVVSNQIRRMIEHGLPVDAVVGPVKVVKGGQNGRSLYLGEATDVPF